MMYDTATMERAIAEAERKGYNKALRELEDYLKERMTSIEQHYIYATDQFKFGVLDAFDNVLTWSFEKYDF